MGAKAVETEMSKVALYPGCSLEGTAAGYRISLEKSLGAMGIEVPVLEHWTCCGATSAHAVDHSFFLALAARNLALAEEQGVDEILAPCAACYHRLAGANFELTQDPEILAQANKEAGLAYRGSVKVRNVLDYLVNVVGPDKIAARVTHPLSDVKTVCYYGCLNTRIPRMASFDDRSFPTTMDVVARALGAEALDWSCKTECCGASLFVSAERTAARLVSKILKDGLAHGANCISLACPMCHNNLDTKQKDFVAEYKLPGLLPAVFITQLMGLAFGLSPKELKMDHSFVPFELKELSLA